MARNPPPRPLRRLGLPLLLAVELAGVCVLAVPALLGCLLAPFDRRLRLLRLAALGASYLGLEVATLFGLGAVWVMRPWRSADWFDGANRRLLQWMLDGLLAAGRRCVGFSVVVERSPTPDPLWGSGPVLVLARHGGIGDSFSLIWLLLSHGDRRPRVVLKQALMWEPLIDVALSRMGGCFLPARAADRATRMAAMAAGLAQDDAMLVFPEGGNWTPVRRARAIQRLRARRQHHAARAAELMEHVLPPRPAGIAACLDARPNLPIAVVAHAGLDTLTTVAKAWRALPFNRPMTVRWWPAPTPPVGEDARLAWLTTEWAVVDEWIDAHGASSRAPTVPG